MAEPLALVATLANFIALADNVYRGVQWMRKAFDDPKIDGLYVRLITEQAKYKAWKRRMGIENNEDLAIFLKRVPVETQETVSTILKPLEKYAIKSQELAEKYAITNPGQEKSETSLKEKLKRLDFRFHGADDLKSMLDTLKFCNDGLSTIATPAPEYYSTLASNDPILDTGGLVDPLDYLRRHRRSVAEDSDQQQDESNRRPIGGNSTAGNQGPSPQRVSFPLIQTTHATCLRSLGYLIMKYPDQTETFEGIGDRLSLWGSGLFCARVSIDQALTRQSPAAKVLRENVIGLLGGFAVTLRKFKTHS